MCYVRRHIHDKWPPLVVFAFWIGTFVWKVDLYKDDIDNNIVTPSTKMKMVWLTNSSMCQATIEWRCCSNMWDHVALSLRSLNKIWKVSTAKHHCLHFRSSTFVFFVSITSGSNSYVLFAQRRNVSLCTVPRIF